MKKCITIGGILFLGFLFASTVKAEDSLPVYRLYNPNSGEHLYTLSADEKTHLVRIGWRDENTIGNSPKSGQPVYRLYNPNNGDHHYTTSLQEYNYLGSIGWNKESIVFYSEAKKSGKPIFRLYNPFEKGAGSHHYTPSMEEYDSLAMIGWKQEEIAWYVTKSKEATDKPNNTNDKPINTDDNSNSNQIPKENDIPIIYVPDDPAKSDSSDTNPPTNTDTDNTTVPPKDTPVNPVMPSEPIDNSSEPNEPMIEPFDGRAVAEEVFRLVNEERRNVGVPELKWNEMSYKPSLIRCNELPILMSHTRPNGDKPTSVLDYKNGRILSAGENLVSFQVQNISNIDIAIKAFGLWKSSEGHYKNMIDKRYNEFTCSFIETKPYSDLSYSKIYGQQFLIHKY